MNRLYNTGFSSSSLGNCEVCKKYCNDVYHLTEQRKYIRADTGEESWTFEGCIDLYGHEECLKKVVKERGGLLEI